MKIRCYEALSERARAAIEEAVQKANLSVPFGVPYEVWIRGCERGIAITVEPPYELRYHHHLFEVEVPPGLVVLDSWYVEERSSTSYVGFADEAATEIKKRIGETEKTLVSLREKLAEIE